MNVDSEILNDYLSETLGACDSLEGILLDLENPLVKDKIDAVNKLFRVFHSIKGASGFLGFHKIEKVAHKVESLLMQIRDGKRELNPIVIDIFLLSSDIVKDLLLYIKKHHTEKETDFTTFVNLLEAELVTPTIDAEKIAKLRSEYFESNSTANTVEEELKIKIKTTEKLLNLSSEIVLVKNALSEILSHSKNPKTVSVFKHFETTAKELQETILKVRMQPIKSLWSKFPRVVRDTALSCGKEAKLILNGENTEVENNILSGLKDPFTHIIRNAVDHGIESPEERVKRNKSKIGVIEFNAYNKEDFIVIEIKDDGAGIDPARVKAKSIEKKLITEEESKLMSDQEAIELIFLPGFSTNNEVSTLSGRGVGMDVVKSSVVQLGGKVEISSQKGVGTLIKLTIPLTLSIIPCLIIKHNEYIFAVPQNCIKQLIPYKSKDISNNVIEYQKQIIPYFDLCEIFEETKHSRSSNRNCIIIKCNDHLFALGIEQIINVQELIINNMPLKTSLIKEFSGNAILANGDISLVLNVEYIMNKLKISEIIHAKESNKQVVENISAFERKKFLSFHLGSKDLYAIEANVLDSVIKVQTPFDSNQKFFRISYRSEIISVLLPHSLIKQEIEETQLSRPEYILILKNDDKYWGVLVNKVFDIFDIETEVFKCLNKRYITSSFYFKNHVYDVLNLESVFEDINPPVLITKAVA